MPTKLVVRCAFVLGSACCGSLGVDVWDGRTVGKHWARYVGVSANSQGGVVERLCGCDKHGDVLMFRRLGGCKVRESASGTCWDIS